MSISSMSTSTARQARTGELTRQDRIKAMAWFDQLDATAKQRILGAVGCERDLRTRVTELWAEFVRDKTDSRRTRRLQRRIAMTS